MVQIMLLWNDNVPEEKAMVDKLKKGFDRMGCWSVELPPKGSIYKMVLTVQKENMNIKEGQNGSKKE